MAENSTASAPDPQLEPLAILEGTWEIEVIHPLMPHPVRGTSVYEWFPGGKFLIERSSMEDPVFPVALILTGYDEASGDFMQHSFDSRGEIRNYYMSLKDHTLKIWRDDPDFAQRMVGNISEDGNIITCRLELARDGKNFDHDFDMTYRRVK